MFSFSSIFPIGTDDALRASKIHPKKAFYSAVGPPDLADVHCTTPAKVASAWHDGSRLPQRPRGTSCQSGP